MGSGARFAGAVPCAAVVVALLAGAISSCRASSSSPGAPAASVNAPVIEEAAAPPVRDAAAPPTRDASAPPTVERACTHDEDCAVARIEPAGEYACCLACAGTPGTRGWHAALQRWCGAHPATNCYPLACPEGPTRAVCRDGVCSATATGADGGWARVPVERRCLPALVCDAWQGCAEVTGNAQDGWFVDEAERAARGDAAVIENVCTTGERCEAARVTPERVTCPPHTVPPVIGAPAYRCALEAGHCRASAAR